ncbi:LuxR C-terminal-related transcriptional regulator [Streptomyces microflavus]
MRPVPPSAALANLLQPVSREIDERLRMATALSRSLFPLTAVAHDDPNLAITVLEGVPAIQASINEATATARDEVLTAQPGSDRPAGKLQEALANAHTAIRRGARIRHIYVEGLIIIDRSVAYIPASADRNTALRISHPALVSYLIQVYEVLWAQAVPLAENHEATAPNAPVTAVQHSIARLLAEGHVDDVVARKMGISVRTCRSHFARLMQTLGATSRTHLGTLLARSGITSTSTSPHEPPT